MAEKKVHKAFSTKAVKKLAQEITGVDTTNRDVTSTIEQMDLTQQRIANLSFAPNVPQEMLNTYEVKGSTFWTNLFWRIGTEFHNRAVFNSKYMRFLIESEDGTGGDILDTFIGMVDSLDRSRLPNSSLFQNFVQQVDIALYRLNRTRVYPTTINESETRASMTSWGQLTSFVNAVIGAIQTGYNVEFDEVVEQTLVNATELGIMPVFTLDENPLASSESMGKTVVATNLIIDRMLGRPRQDYMRCNLSTQMTEKQVNNSQEIPLVLFRDDIVRTTEHHDAMRFYFSKREPTSSTDTTAKDWQRNLIPIEWDIFPKTYKFINSDRTYTDAELIDLEANDRAVAVKNGFTGVNAIPTGYELVGYVLSPDALILRNQFKLDMKFENALTLNTTHAFHVNQFAHLSMFQPIVAIIAPVLP